MSRVEKLYDLVGVNTPTIVYVDPAGVPGTNCDFIDIPSAAAYLRGLPEQRGGIIAIKGGVTYNINVAVDIRGLTIKGVGAGTPAPIINAVTGGSLQVGGTVLDGITVVVPVGFAGTYFIDIFENGPNDYRACDFRPAVGKYIFGCSVGPYTTDLTFIDCGQGDQNGAMIDVAAVFAALNIWVLGTDTQGMMKFGTRAIATNTEGRADSTTMASFLNAYFVVAPGENIQARLNAIAVLGGGMCVLLPGIHQVTTSLLILSNNTVLRGAGKSTVVRAIAPWGGGVGYWDAVIMIGRKATATIVNRSSAENLKVEQQIFGVHGCCSYGGMDNKFEDVIAEAQVDCIGGYFSGFSMSDSTGDPAVRPQLKNCIVTTDGVGTNRYSDGYHVDGSLLPGLLFGHGNRVQDPLISNCVVDWVMFSSFVFSGNDKSRFITNESTRSPVNVAGVPLIIYDCTDMKALGNDISQCPASGAGAFVVYMAASPRTIFIGNTIDGGVNAFGEAVSIVDSGLLFPGTSDRCVIAHNIIRNSTSGIQLYDPLTTGCIIEPNIYELVTTRLTDASATTKYVGTNQIGTGNPNGVVSGNYGDVFFDTATNTLYKCTSYPQGTVWQVI